MILKILIIILVLAFSGWIAWDNARIVITNIHIHSEHLPKAFEGYKIAHVSDLHNDEFGKDNEKLIALLASTKPDMIAITGDLLDSRRTSEEKALTFVKQAVTIAPTYYVTGNHESRQTEFEAFQREMQNAGVVVLRDDKTVIEKEGAKLEVLGIDDPRFKLTTDKRYKMENEVGKVLSNLLKNVESDTFTMLLSHRPELFDLYCEKQLDVVLTGHVHGGQFRIPFIGGVIGPSQGMFPEYDAGLYTRETTNMIVSRGLGQSIFPFRFNNPPELVLIELQ